MSRDGEPQRNYAVLISRFAGSGQWDRSLETAREWLAADPENIEAHMAAGQALLNLGKPGESERHIARVLAAAPGFDIAHRFMAIACYRQKRFKEADESIHKAISSDPNDFHNWFFLAEMCYHQGDFGSARKYAEKARELAPRDPDVLNLLILSQRDGTNPEVLEQYKEALELDPENANILNNMGVYHLNAKKDYRQAEDFFRRALFFEPRMKEARSNLFVAIKHRDIVYRILCSPRDLCVQIAGYISGKRKQSIWLYLLFVPVWILLFRFVLAGLVLWFALFWPLVKVYEFLTVGDIRSHAGEIGARRGGIFNYRRWPVKARLSIFGLLLVGFWGGLVMLYCGSPSEKHEDYAQMILGIIVLCGLIFAIGFWVRARMKNWRASMHARARKKRLGDLTNTQSD